jgi:pSer/pThr/pTyr-binding forkhead associated (FHA) protein
MFEPMQGHGQNTAELRLPSTLSRPDWLGTARGMLPGPGRYLARRQGEGEIEVFRIEEGWTRIGRSSAADIRLDDPSVSRRHALIVSEPPDALRLLDDRSLNGVFLNGELIEWGRLEDCDQLAIGRYRLIVLET